MGAHHSLKVKVDYVRNELAYIRGEIIEGNANRALKYIDDNILGYIKILNVVSLKLGEMDQESE